MTEIFQNIDGIIFDFDGTLYNKKQFAVKLLCQNIKDIFLIKAERKTRNQLKGVDFLTSENFYKNFFEKMAKNLQNKKYTAEFLRKWYFEKYLVALTNTLQKYYNARNGAEKIFEILAKKNIKVAVFSDYAAVAERMSAIGLSTETRNLFNAEEFGALKPSVRPFLEIAEKLQTTPEKTLVIGDRADTDGIGAKNAGMKFLHLIEKNGDNLENAVTWEKLIFIL
ncbi:MAG: HAD family hydrolase [Prevotellaceae bacterium]|jgi:HAD superfamily hydrolase (TIGR01549 family)|nr:HAD family hydrolase [Prevotellaceae bacterium]